jgi:hypothetical protein
MAEEKTKPAAVIVTVEPKATDAELDHMAKEIYANLTPPRPVDSRSRTT